jgi:hypothetical protein
MRWCTPPGKSIFAFRGMKTLYQTPMGVTAYIFVDVTHFRLFIPDRCRPFYLAVVAPIKSM